MTNPITFLDIEDVRDAHASVFYRLGENPRPLVSPDRLDGALARVANAAIYRGASIVELAAMSAVAISQAQAFVDGNKRAAEGAMNAFLRFNGYRFTGNWMQVALFLEVNAYLSEVANRGDEPREKGLEAFALWLGTVIEAV